MPNRQKLFETGGSVLMVITLGLLIASAILAWYQVGNCQYAWFSYKCDTSSVSDNRGPVTKNIYNAAYGLIVAACVIQGICCIIYALYVFGTQSQRCVWIHLLSVLTIAAAVITFGAGLPDAVKQDSGQPATPFFSGSSGQPAVGWWLALVAGIMEVLVFLLYFFAFKSC